MTSQQQGRVGPAGDLAGPPAVEVEVLLLRPAGVDGLGYRVLRAALTGRSSPDEVATASYRAARASGAERADGADGADGADVQVLHSTSWRYEPGRGVVLTYAALPDPDPTAPGTTLVDPAVVSSGDPLRPAPDLLHGHHVVAHAVRHLAELARRDPAVRAAAGTADEAGRELWRRLTDLAPRVPTGTHEDAHAAARAVAPAQPAEPSSRA
ncbi:hypothetical protein [Jannaschia sp. R86511]|uniref:hypothetical protein n=1 Tax=Jannaschia sp. R86511 TaxID=3093853 RepID=UPI0036D3F76E